MNTIDSGVNPLTDAKIAAHGRGMTSSQLREIRSFGQVNKDTLTKEEHAALAVRFANELAAHRVEADKRANPNGAWQRGDIRRDDNLRRQKEEHANLSK